MADEYVVDTSDQQIQRAERKQGQRRTALARSAVRAPGRAARAVTSYSGEKVLAAELMVGFTLVAIRVVADYESQADGTTTGKVLHPAGQYGPLPILAGLIMSFFALSFVAAGGGTRAKLAVILGGAIVLTLGVHSYKEIQTVGGTIGKIGTIVVPGASGNEGSGASNANTASSPAGGTPGVSPGAANYISNPATNSVTGTALSAGGIFPTPTGAAPPLLLPAAATPTQYAQQAAANANQAAINAAKADAASLQKLSVGGVVTNTFKLSVDGVNAAIQDARNAVSSFFGGL